jgi:hypothetical protein
MSILHLLLYALRRQPALVSVIGSLALLMFSCISDPVSEPGKSGEIEYLVSIPEMGMDTLTVHCSLRKWESEDSVRFVAPPVYADNRLLVESENNFHNLRIETNGGQPVEYATDSMTVGPENCFTFAFSSLSLPATIRYSVTFHYDSSFILPRPGIDGAAGFLQGSYVFIIPYRNRDCVHIWRDPFPIGVTYECGPDVAVMGDPVPRVLFNNAYELLFSTSALSPLVLGSGGSGREDFRLVTLRTDTCIDNALLDKVFDDYQRMFGDIKSIFGEITECPVTVILGNYPRGGFEGMYAFSIFFPWHDDPPGVFNQVIAHETIHCWVGLRVGDYDDPWWKEGTTNYLGFLIALRNGLIQRSYFEDALMGQEFDTAIVNAFSMDDPRLRSSLFSSDTNFAPLVYTKGAQVSMLMDYAIRLGTSNAWSLDMVLGAFVKEFDGRAFHRWQYLDFIYAASGVDIGGIFSRYVDTPGIIPADTLSAAYHGLDSLGAFTNRDNL